MSDVTIAFRLPEPAQRRRIIDIPTEAWNTAVSQKGAQDTVDATKLSSTADIGELIAHVGEANASRG